VCKLLSAVANCLSPVVCRAKDAEIINSGILDQIVRYSRDANKRKFCIK
jgi:hypothetical protein